MARLEGFLADAETGPAVPVLNRMPMVGRRNMGAGDMRLARTSLALALMVAPAGPIYADPSDLTKITCKQLADSGEDDSAIILVLIYGFILGKEDKPTVDPKKMDADVERFQNACDKTPDATAMSVATETFSR